MTYNIYKLQIQEYFYIGSSKTKTRYTEHKSVCFNTNNDKYNLKVYRKIRELTIQDRFYDDVKEIILEKDITDDKKSEIEDKYIDLDNPHCLNSQRENQHSYSREYNNNIRSEYYNRNKDKVKQDQLRYYNKNKDIINIKSHCYVCDCNTTARNIKRHNESIKHRHNYLLYSVDSYNLIIINIKVKCQEITKPILV